MPIKITRTERKKVEIRLRRDIEAERLFVRWKRIAFSAAKKISTLTGRNLLELQDEALAFLGELAMGWRETFDPARGVQPQTWVYTKIYWRCMSYAITHQRPKREIELLTEDFDYEAPHHLTRIERILLELSEEAQALVGIVLEGPACLARELGRALRKGADLTDARLALLEHLREKKWDEEQIDAAWSEVSLCLQS